MPSDDNIPLGRVKTPVWAATGVAEFDGWGTGGAQCRHKVVDLWDTDGHNFLAVLGYHEPSELQIVVDLINNYADIVYAARDLLESGVIYKEGGEQSKLITALEHAVFGKPELEEEQEDGYTLGEVQFDL